MYIFCLSDCCSSIDVVGKGDALNAHPDIFTTYTLEPGDLINGKKHYTSQDGTKAIAYNEEYSGQWLIQAAEKRYCIKFEPTGTDEIL